MPSRRTILKGLLGALALPLARLPRAARPQTLDITSLAYKDSIGTADLTSLRDGVTVAGGISYGA